MHSVFLSQKIKETCLKVVLNRAVDGIEDPYSRCTLTAHSQFPWLVIDLQGSYGTTYVRILNRNNPLGK